MSSSATDDQVSSYQTGGVILLKSLFDNRWLAELAEGIEENLRNPSRRVTTYANDPTNDEHFR